MKTFLRLLAAAAAAAVVGVTPSAHAVIGGSPDGDAHPYVGFSAFFSANGTFLWRCSGALVAPTVYVTAGHCAGPEFPGAPQPAFVKISFSNGLVSGKADAVGVPVAMPGWTGELPGHDLGVVKLSAPVTDRGFATLAPSGYLDALTTKRGQQDVSFTVVGYGVQDFDPQGFVAIPMRFSGDVQLEKLTDIDLLTTASPGNGTGGAQACLGDSGGPLFSGGYLVAVTSYGSKYCNGRSGAFRVDTADAQSFIASAGS